jgi:hypothetical protein
VKIMSAVLVDELVVSARLVQRPARAAEAAARLAAPVASVPVVARAVKVAPVGVTHDGGWRLTDRGIAVVLTLFVGLFVAGVAVVVTSFLTVSDAPVAARGDAVVAVGAVR